MMILLHLLACGPGNISLDTADGGHSPDSDADTDTDADTDADTDTDTEPDGPDWSLGEEQPPGTGLASCVWTLYGAARAEFSGDADLVVVAADGDLSGGAENCLGVFKSRSNAGRVAHVYYDGRDPIVQEEGIPDLPYCSGGTVQYETLVGTPVEEWYVDSVVLESAFADVPSSTRVSILVAPPALLPDVNLCTGGNYHFDVESDGLRAVLVGAARDCGEDGVYCAVAIDARSGDILDRE